MDARSSAAKNQLAESDAKLMKGFEIEQNKIQLCQYVPAGIPGTCLTSFRRYLCVSAVLSPDRENHMNWKPIIYIIFCLKYPYYDNNFRK